MNLLHHARRLSMPRRQGLQKVGCRAVDCCDWIKGPHSEHLLSVEPNAQLLALFEGLSAAKIGGIGARRGMMIFYTMTEF